MDLTNKEAEKIYRKFQVGKTITNIKNPNLEIKFMEIEGVIFFICVIIIRFRANIIFSGIFANIIYAIIVAICIAGILSKIHKIYFYGNNIIYENLLKKRKIIDVNEENEIFVTYDISDISVKEHDGDYRTEKITEYNLHIKQGNIEIVLDIKEVGNKKIRLLLNNLEIK